MRVTTAKCPDGKFYGAAWREDGSLVAMSPEMPNRSAARRWALNHIA